EPNTCKNFGSMYVKSRASGSSIDAELKDFIAPVPIQVSNCPHLKLVKTVTNDNGGTAKTTDFTLTATGPTTISGAGGVEKEVDAGSYTLSETTLATYTAGSWSCTGGTFTSPDKIALASGDSAVCALNYNH